jgi:CDP-4-dehydro-6-deoxyglucose reductase, E3
MNHQITFMPSGHHFAASEDESLLEAALRQGYTLPYGCKDGACGACKGKVLSGTVDHGKAMDSALTPDDRAAGQALFCCASARSDLVLESRQMTSNRDFPVKTLPSRIEKLERLAPDVMAISLKLPASEKLQFHAGQYIDILLKDGRKRSFSLANAPHDDALLVLHVRHVPGGLFTDQVFSSLKVRDILRFSGPLGSFYLREESTKPIILLAGGTGFAPIKAIIEHAQHQWINRPMHLYWGARARVDLYQHDLPLRWAAAHPTLRYVPVLSEPTEGDAWAGRTGLVHQAVTVDFPNLANFQVYACGSPGMIDAARRDFVAAGLPEEEFFADAFSFSAR